MNRAALLWQLADLFGQVARFKLWWATHYGDGAVE